MQTFEWYVRRLRSMSPGELWWRLRGKAQQLVDRPLVSLRGRPVPVGKVAPGQGSLWKVRSEAVGRDLPGVGVTEGVVPGLAEWKHALLDRAERIARNRLTLFDMQDHDLGGEIDWNYEYKAGKKTPMIFSPLIDYRDYAETGDCKFVWEPSRHYHLVALGRAYRVSGERAFAMEVLEQIESWIKQCPYGVGMNWRSPLELGIRMINWVWALELIRPAGLITPQRAAPILVSVYRHLWEIARKYSRFSSANNHLIGEAAGVFIASSYFAGLQGAPTWRRESREILLREIGRQTYADGGNREQAFGYHLFVLEFFLLSGLVARNRAEDFPAEYWGHLERMFDFLCGMVEGGEHAPMFGDADDGYVLDLGSGRPSPRELLSIGACLFGRGDFKAEAGEFSEQAFWLLGKPGYDRFERIRVMPSDEILRLRAFEQSGYYLLQSGWRGGTDRLSIVFDCGELGLGAIAAHGHADALSFTLRAFGRDVLVDPGTYDYFTFGRWRNYFRSTRAHNTVVVDEGDQSEMQGAFLWGRRAQARCTRWETTEQGGLVAGEHDGYAKGPNPVVHRREVSFDREQRVVVVKDELSGTGPHKGAWYFHLAEGCTVCGGEGNRFELDCGAGKIVLELDPLLSVTLLVGSEEPIGGWVSRGYHRREASTTLVARRDWQERTSVETRIRVGGP